MTAVIRAEAVFALPGKQVLRAVELPAGATVDDVIAASGLRQACPGQDLDDLQAGIWGRPVARDQLVQDGDRVELYRPLLMDPRDARRLKVGR